MPHTIQSMSDQYVHEIIARRGPVQRIEHPTRDRIHELALKSIAALNRRGWWKGSLVSEVGEVCAQGAMLCALDIDPVFANRHGVADYRVQIEFETLNRAFKDICGFPTVTFNDKVADGKQSILEAFWRIAEKTAPPRLPVGTQADHELAAGEAN